MLRAQERRCISGQAFAMGYVLALHFRAHPNFTLGAANVHVPLALVDQSSPHGYGLDPTSEAFLRIPGVAGAQEVVETVVKKIGLTGVSRAHAAYSRAAV